MKHESFAICLSEELAAACIDLTDHQMQQLSAHWDLIKSWSRRINLTAIVDERRAAVAHYRDSLEALPLLGAGPVVDIGSGAGFPGIPLAVARPDQSFALIEPRRKRASFLRVAAVRLRLPNVRVLECRVQDPPDCAYETALTRATFSDVVDLRQCGNWLGVGGKLLIFRKEATPGAERLHHYSIEGEARVIEIWTFPRAFTNR